MELLTTELLTTELRDKLIANGRASEAAPGGIDHAPVVKLFTPDGSATWLLSELDPEMPDFAFGLCDLGFGFPELGSVSITEIEEIRGKLNLPVERDQGFRSNLPVGMWSSLARETGSIASVEAALRS